MFKTTITETSFTNRMANDYFNRIFGADYAYDMTFIATLRALLSQRMSEDDFLRLEYISRVLRKERIERYQGDLDYAVRAVFNRDNSVDNGIFIYDIRGTDEDTTAWLSLIKEHFIPAHKEMNDWHILEKVTELYKPIATVYCFVDPEKRSTVIFINDLDFRKWHALQAAIPGYIPWYFSEKTIDEDEKALLDSLFKYKTEDRYIECINKIAEKLDFKKLMVRKLLDGFETQVERQECDNITRTIENYIEDVRRHNAEIRRLMQLKANDEIRLLGLKEKLKKEGNSGELMEYFSSNNNVSLEGVNNTRITFVAKGYITYFDESMAQKIIDNESSYVYDASDRSRISKEDMKNLMTALFVDQTLKIRVCAAYELRISCGVEALRGYEYGADFAGYTPNPHTDKYGCMGSYESQINDLIFNNDYIGAIEQCVASCNSLNFADSTVMSEFMNRLYGRNGSNSIRSNPMCIELPDGKVVRPTEAVAYLNSKKQENKEHEQEA